jgi:hypothetical protein
MPIIAEKPVSQRYEVLKGIKNFRALSDINPYSALLFNQKSLNKSLLNSLFNPLSHESYYHCDGAKINGSHISG